VEWDGKKSTSDWNVPRDTHAQQQQQICRLKLPAAALNKDVNLIHNSCILFIEQWRIVDSSSSWAW